MKIKTRKAHMLAEPFNGTWKLNVPASTLPFPAPRSVVLHIEVDGDRVTLVEKTVSSIGESENTKIEAKFNNETHPIIGSGIADGFAVHRVNSHEWRTQGFKAGVVVFSAALVLSGDEQSFREFGETTLADGRRAAVSLIYERYEDGASAIGGQ